MTRRSQPVDGQRLKGVVVATFKHHSGEGFGPVTLVRSPRLRESVPTLNGNKPDKRNWCVRFLLFFVGFRSSPLGNRFDMVGRGAAAPDDIDDTRLRPALDFISNMSAVSS